MTWLIELDHIYLLATNGDYTLLDPTAFNSFEGYHLNTDQVLLRGGQDNNRDTWRD